MKCLTISGFLFLMACVELGSGFAIREKRRVITEGQLPEPALEPEKFLSSNGLGYGNDKWKQSMRDLVRDKDEVGDQNVDAREMVFREKRRSGGFAGAPAIAPVPREQPSDGLGYGYGALRYQESKTSNGIGRERRRVRGNGIPAPQPQEQQPDGVGLGYGYGFARQEERKASGGMVREKRRAGNNRQDGAPDAPGADGRDDWAPSAPFAEPQEQQPYNGLDRGYARQVAQKASQTMVRERRRVRNNGKYHAPGILVAPAPEPKEQPSDGLGYGYGGYAVRYEESKTSIGRERRGTRGTRWNGDARKRNQQPSGKEKEEDVWQQPSGNEKEEDVWQGGWSGGRGILRK